MRYGPEHKQAARAKILEAAGRGFRRLGFAGIGVDGLAQEAGVTSGAFYGHFASKTAAFEAVAIAALVELREGIELLQARDGAAWLPPFIDFYVNVKRTCELGASCALQTIAPEIARAEPEVRTAFEAELTRVAEAMANGLPGASRAARRKLAWTILAMLSGMLTISRATQDAKLGAQIAGGVKAAILAMVDAER